MLDPSLERFERLNGLAIERSIIRLFGFLRFYRFHGLRFDRLWLHRVHWFRLHRFDVRPL